MRRWKKSLIGIAVVALVMLGFMIWYKVHFSMSPAREFEVKTPAAAAKVLIATQASAFKDSVVAGVVEHLGLRPAYVKVIDVSALSSVHEADWNAILVIHTWEMRQPQPDAKQFMERIGDHHKVIVLSTSGAGTLKLDGVDTISSASVMTDVPRRVAEIDSRIDAILDAQPDR